jgi:putative transcriptional regulator
MQRVHRNLSRDEVEALRVKLSQAVPGVSAEIPELLRTLRLITRQSQSEYARMCGVAPRALSTIESGSGKPTVETLGKLLRPFGYRVGIVRESEDPLTRASLRAKVSGPPENRIARGRESALSRAMRASARRPEETRPPGRSSKRSCASSQSPRAALSRCRPIEQIGSGVLQATTA